MELPKPVQVWAEQEGILAEELHGYLSTLGDSLGMAGAGDALGVWLEGKVKKAMTPERLIAAAAFIIAEVKSGHPGFNPDHGGLL